MNFKMISKCHTWEHNAAPIPLISIFFHEILSVGDIFNNGYREYESKYGDILGSPSNFVLLDNILIWSYNLKWANTGLFLGIYITLKLSRSLSC